MTRSGARSRAATKTWAEIILRQETREAAAKADSLAHPLPNLVPPVDSLERLRAYAAAVAAAGAPHRFAPLMSLPHLFGTTLATNALIERRGARTALVTNQGFREAQKSRVWEPAVE